MWHAVLLLLLLQDFGTENVEKKLSLNDEGQSLDSTD